MLVVDDEEMIRELARDILVRYGYTVVTAAGGTEAVEIYRRNGSCIAVVVLDILMPDMGGREVFRLIREIDPAAQLLLRLQPRLFRSHQPENDILSAREQSQRLEATGSFIVIFKQEAIHIQKPEKFFCNGFITALRVPAASAISATDVQG